MTRRSAARLVAVGLLLLGGCGDDDDVRADERPSTAEGPPTDLPVAFAGPEDGWPTVLATAGLLVGYGGGAGDPSELGQVVDLTTGETWGLGRPESDPPFSPGTAVALDDELVVSGFRCPPGTMGSEVADPCRTLATYRVDPATATWEDVPVLAGSDLVEELFATPDGAVALFRAVGRDVNLVARLEPDGWREVGTSPREVPRCATATEMFTMVQGAGPVASLGPGYPPEATSTWTMTATSLIDGTSRAVPLPELPRFFGAAAIGLVCGREAPVLTSTDEELRSAVRRLVDGQRWEEVPGVVPSDGRHSLTGMASGEVAVVGVTEVVPGATERSPMRGVAVTAEGGVVPIDDLDLGADVELVPRGSDGPYAAVGPRREPPAEGQDEGPPADPVPLRLLPSYA